MITLENGKNLQNTLSIAHTSRAFPFFIVFALVCKVFEVGKREKESKIFPLSDNDVPTTFVHFLLKKISK